MGIELLSRLCEQYATDYTCLVVWRTWERKNLTGNMLVCSHVDIFRLNYFSVYCVHFIFAVYSAYNRQMSPNLAKPSL